jgi:outer membrane immunogenic protein
MFARSAAILGLAIVATTGAQAADLIIPTAPEPIMESYSDAGFDWTGFYVGANAGGEFTGENTNGVVGALAGYNFAVTDGVVVGIEGRADYVFNDDFNAGEYLALARVGVTPTDSVLIYAAAGAGYRNTSNDGDSEGGIYAVGGGAELAVTESVSVRGEVLGIGFLGDGLNGDNGLVAAKATTGVMFHF